MQSIPARRGPIPGDRCARRRAILIVAAALAFPCAARATDPPLSYAEAVRLAAAQSPQLASQRAMADAAREMAGPAGELPDPKLRLGIENVPADGPDLGSLRRDFMTMTRIGLMQEFPRREKRQLRSQRALRDAERVTAAIDVSTLSVKREAATAWLVRRYSADAERAIADQIAEAELVVTTAAAAYRAGRAPQTDVIAAQTAVIELRNRATEADAQTKRARIALARYIGADAGRALGDAPDVARLPFDARGRDLVSVVHDLQAAVAREVKLPAGYSLSWSGQFEYLERAKARLAYVVPFTLLVIFVLLFLAFRRLDESLTIMLAVPFALVGGYWLLWLLGYSTSVATAVGFIALAGVAAEFGVVMLIYLRTAWEARLSTGAPANEAALRDAIEEGAVLRVRPKAMTVAVIMAGLLPIMISEGTGAEVMQRIAAPMVGGMVTAPLLSMLVIPAAYLLLRRRGLR